MLVIGNVDVAGFLADSSVRDALTVGIAAAVPGVESENVKILGINAGDRRLVGETSSLSTSSVEVNYTFHHDGSGGAPMNADQVQTFLSSEGAKEKMNIAMNDAGLTYSIESMAATRPTVTVDADSETDGANDFEESSAGLADVHIMTFLISATLVFVYAACDLMAV